MSNLDSVKFPAQNLLFCLFIITVFSLPLFVGSGNSIGPTTAILSVAAALAVIWIGLRSHKRMFRTKWTIYMATIPTLLFLGYIAVQAFSSGSRLEQIRSQLFDLPIGGYREQLIYAGDKPIGIQISLVHQQNIALQRSKISVSEKG